MLISDAFMETELQVWTEKYPVLRITKLITEFPVYSRASQTNIHGNHGEEIININHVQLIHKNATI